MNTGPSHATALYAVTGKPVAHSLSPQMHNAAFEALGMDAAYVRLAAADAESALAAAGSMGLAGMNVTAPYKEGMAALVDRMDEEAESVGAVNTVVFEDGRAKGRNTDVYGVRGALEENGILLRGRKAVVLGAGGAAKAAARALTSAGAEVTIANRTVDRARALARPLGCAHCGLAGQELARAMAAASVVVSSLGTAGRVIPHDVLRRSMTILEAKYDEKTALGADALRIGCRVIDGREWLLYQGARAFRIFTHRKPPLDAMRKALYSQPAGKKANIALIGFMGSGKTTVARRIAATAGRRIVDTDEDIEAKAGKRIADIFQSGGEPEFRKLEKAEVAKIAGLRGRVVACGGGVVLDPDNVRVLRGHCSVAWLWAGPKAIFSRIRNDESRPLLDHPERERVAREMIARRLKAYASASDIVAGTEGKKPEEIAELILDEVGEALRH